MKEFQEKISIVSFWIVMAIGAIALAGWFVKELTLAGMGKNSIPMAPVTIVCFILISFSALKLKHKGLTSKLPKVIFSFVFLVCLIILIDALNGYPLNLEYITGKSPGSLYNFPIGRMSPITSVLFLLSSTSLLAVSSDSAFKRLATVLSIAGLLTSFIFDLGYLYGTPLLYGHGIIPPAWNTALAFTFLFTGILTGFGMNERPLNLLLGKSVRARLMRNFLPSTLLIIIFTGWIDSIFIKIFNDHVLVSALVTFCSLLILSYIILKLSENIGSDIDEIFTLRKKTEEILRESELHFRTLADSGQALIWTSGIDKKCNYFNSTWLEFTGRTLEQEMGDGWVEGVHPDDLDYCFKTYVNAFERRERFSMDYRLRYRDGSYHWIQDNGTPRFNLKGEFIGYIGHCLDITERKKAEEDLMKSEERYRLISSVATDYTFSTIVTPDGVLSLEWIAGAFESISGYSVSEFVARGGWRSTVHPDDLEIDDLDIAQLRNNQKTESQLRTINKNGETVWVQVFAHPVWDYEKNCLAGIYGAVKNITDKKNADEKLINSELRFRELLEKVNLIAIIIDDEGNVTFCNEHLLKLIGYRRDELVGKNWFELMIPKENPEVKNVFIKGLETGQVAARFENPIITKTGEKLDIVWSNVVQKRHDGTFSGVASIGEDITERKQAEEKIRILNEELEMRVIERTKELEKRSKELIENEKALLKLVEDLNIKSEELQRSSLQLEAANKELEAFSYSVSHDLRAPLRAVSGFVGILLEDYGHILDDEGKRVCNIIYSNALKMGQLIDDLLSFSRLIRSELRHSKIDMEGMVKSVIAEFESVQDLSNKNITVEKLPSAMGDPNLLKQVWINLLSNAIKYSSKKEDVTIKIGSYTEQNEQVYYIEDNGVGFNMDYAHKLFGVFQRLHSVNEFEGTGVGLAIVQRIINRHFGRVWAEGKVGNGAKFSFALPIS